MAADFKVFPKDHPGLDALLQAQALRYRNGAGFGPVAAYGAARLAREAIANGLVLHRQRTGTETRVPTEHLVATLTQELGLHTLSWDEGSDPDPDSGGSGALSADFHNRVTHVSLLSSEHYSELSWLTLDKGHADRLRELTDGFGSSRDGVLYAIQSYGDGGLGLRSVGEVAAPLERGNYTPAIVEQFDRLVADLRDPNPIGRLSILSGPPGTGKTWMVRGIIAACPDAQFIHCPAEMVAKLDGPSLLGVFTSGSLKKKSTDPSARVFVIEDGDECIAARGPDNRSTMRALLNLTDGMLGKALDLRCVVTSNSGHLKRTADIDRAVLRPGRLSEHLEIDSLERDHAATILERIVGKEAAVRLLGDVSGRGKAPTLAEIYLLARNHERAAAT